jgi:hypothetical protein
VQHPQIAVLVLALLVHLDLVCLSQVALLALFGHLALMTRFALEGLAQAEQSLGAKDPARSQGSINWLALCWAKQVMGLKDSKWCEGQSTMENPQAPW